ncbi:MAG TPA: chloride channel protein [Bacteroidales bacterium]|nr:chloride channel protein [Bacteroidales bacterium]
MKMRTKDFQEKVSQFRMRYLPGHRFLYLVSGFVGLAVGGAAVLIKNLVHLIQKLLSTGFNISLNSYLIFLLPILGITLAVIFIKFINRKPVRHGIPGVLFAISRNNAIMRTHNLYSSIISSALTVGFGGSVGLEGPTVATGGAIGSNVGRLFNLSYKEVTLLLTAACAGAMSAIFKAPIAGIVFALEVIMIDLTMWVMIPLLIASATAALTSYFFLGQNVLYSFEVMEDFQMNQVHYYILLGVITGLISVYFTKVYNFITEIFERIDNFWKRLIIAGGILGAIIFLLPPLFGEGYEVVNQSLKGNISQLFDGTFYSEWQNSFLLVVIAILLIIALKVVATTLTFAAGGIGGVFAPTLFMGANLGLLFGLILNQLGVDVSSSNMALVGMAGMIAGVIHAPLTAIFLVAEISSGYELFMPLILVSTISFATTRYFVSNSVYTIQLAKRGELMTHHKDKNILLLMNVSELIEKNFKKVHPDDTLGDLVKVITKSSRNIFPVVTKDEKFVGIVKLDDIRHIMFNQDVYDKTFVRDLMFMPEYTVDIEEQMEQVAGKFTKSGRYNIAVVNNGKYVGFLSRARVFSSYREMLKHFSDD